MLLSEMPVSGMREFMGPALLIDALDAGQVLDGADAGGRAAAVLEPALRRGRAGDGYGEAELVVVAASECEPAGLIAAVALQQFLRERQPLQPEFRAGTAAFQQMPQIRQQAVRHVNGSARDAAQRDSRSDAR